MRRRVLLVASATPLAALSLSGCATFGEETEKPRADHSINVANEDDETHTLGVLVQRPREDTIVYEAEHTVEPGDEREVYNLREANPDGVEPFKLTGRLADERMIETIETSECYGDGFVSVDADGRLSVFYAIC